MRGHGLGGQNVRRRERRQILVQPQVPEMGATGRVVVVRVVAAAAAAQGYGRVTPNQRWCCGRRSTRRFRSSSLRRSCSSQRSRSRQRRAGGGRCRSPRLCRSRPSRRTTGLHRSCGPNKRFQHSMEGKGQSDKASIAWPSQMPGRAGLRAGGCTCRAAGRGVGEPARCGVEPDALRVAEVF